MDISSYEKSLWVRNVLLALFVMALIASAVKVGLGMKKIALYGQARDYYATGNIVLAEETFAKASDISAIRYGDEAWNESMSTLTSTRLDLESLSQRLHTAILEKNGESVLESYQTYQSLKQANGQQDKQATFFFREISRRLGIEGELASYYQKTLEQEKAHMKANLAQQNYNDESFIHTLIMIPDEYYGGRQKKQDELSALFLSYEKTKLHDTSANQSFTQVVTETAKNVRAYEKEGFPTEWLVKLLEKYALNKMNKVIREKDLTAFVTQAKAYREIQGVLPADSDVLSLIDRHLEDLLEKAKQYAASHQFSKALDLYQNVSGLQHTSALITDLENRWISYDPTRLLKTKYPDKTLRTVMTGEDRWRAEAYAIGWDEAERHLYAAALMPDDSSIYLDQALDIDGKTASFRLSDQLGTSTKSPAILIEAAGKERSFSYTGLYLDFSENKLVQQFQIEADGFTAESTDEIVIENPVGQGEHEIALFKLDRSGLVYEGKKADMQPEGTPPPDVALPADDGNGASSGPQTFDVHTGPGEDYERIGQIPGNSAFQVMAELNGWYQIEFDGKEGWIHAPQTTP